MRLTAALITSVALHLAVAAIPGLEPASRSASSSPAERIVVALPQTARAQATPKEANPPGDLATEKRIGPETTAVDSAREVSIADSGETSWFGIPLPRYYEPKELTERAKPLVDITLDSPVVEAYPDAGKIVLLLYINEEGKVDDVEVLSSDIASSKVEATVVEQFQLVRFTAGKLNGQPVKSKKKIEVVIKPPLVITPGAVPSLPAPARGN